MKFHRCVQREIAQQESTQTKVNSKGLFANILKYVPLWLGF